MMISEFEQWLRSRTNQEKRPFQEETVLAYAKAAHTRGGTNTKQRNLRHPFTWLEAEYDQSPPVHRRAEPDRGRGRHARIAGFSNGRYQHLRASGRTASGDYLTVMEKIEPSGISDSTGSPGGRYRPTDVCDAGIADKLGIPAAYLRRTRDCHPGLFDANVNGWLERDDRRFFIRALTSGGPTVISPPCSG